MTQSTKTEMDWFVIYTRSNAEKKLAEELESSGFHIFLPTYTTVRQWSDRKKKVITPLIKGIVFIQTTRKDLNKVYAFHHVRGVLKENAQPGIVREEEIQNLKIIAHEWNGDVIETNHSYNLEKGDEIEVERGPFAGLTGELVNINGKHRVVVRLRSLQVEFSVNVSLNAVRKINGE
jgi:transcription antitermination factor NusG